jgi:hypothetical protein
MVYEIDARTNLVLRADPLMKLRALPANSR